MIVQTRKRIAKFPVAEGLHCQTALDQGHRKVHRILDIDKMRLRRDKVVRNLDRRFSSFPRFGNVLTFDPGLTVRSGFFFPDGDDFFEAVDPISRRLEYTGITVRCSAGD